MSEKGERVKGRESLHYLNKAFLRKGFGKFYFLLLLLSLSCLCFKCFLFIRIFGAALACVLPGFVSYLCIYLL